MSTREPDVDISSLTSEQRLRLIEQLWDSLSEQPSAIPVTDAQREELDRRLDEIESGDAEGVPWEQVQEEIRKRRR